MKKIIILFLAIILLSGCGVKRLDKAGEIMQKVQTKYDKATSIQVDFINSNYLKSSVINFKGHTIYKSPDRYYSQVNINNFDAKNEQSKYQGTITYVSDGLTLWQESQQNKGKPHVFKKNLKDSQAKENVYTILFKETNVLNKNIKLLRTEQPKNIFYYVLELKAPDKLTLLWIDGDQWQIDKTETYYGSSQAQPKDLINRTVYSNYIFNKDITDDKFKYSPPQGAITEPYKS